MKRGLVIQGGGSKFAFVAGELAYHIGVRGHDWDEYYGTSAGALAALIASTGDAELLKTTATTMSNKDIWSKNPMRRNGKLNYRNLFLKLAFKKDALGSTSNLRKQIEKFYTEEMFNEIRESKLVAACASNYTAGGVYFGHNIVYDYKTFLDFVWASTCVPVLCEPVSIQGEKFQDGGLLLNTPIQQAIDNGCDEIDVFLLSPKPSISSDGWEGSTLTDYAGRSIEMMSSYISERNMIIANITAKNKQVKLRFRYTPEKLCKNTMDAMNFDKNQMTKWYYQGYNYAAKRGESDKIKIK